MHRPQSLLAMLLLALLIATPGPASAACATRALVSGYNSNNVHVYDGCTGAFERVLDSAGRLGGPQAVKIGPDGWLYVVSEKNGRIVRYDAATLDFKDIFISTGAGYNPTGVAFGPDGDVYVAGYNADAVRRYDATTGVLKATVVSGNSALLNGPDCGMTFGPDGRLYIPGYLTNNVVVWDPATNAASTFIAARAGGLSKSRGILFEPGGTVLVSSEGTGELLRYNAGNGAFIARVTAGLGTVTGISAYPDGTVLAASDNSAVRVSTSGALLGQLVQDNAGGLNGGTFAAVVPVAQAPTVDASQVGAQYWVGGSGVAAAKEIDVNEVFTGVGTSFGDAFKPQDVTLKRWGRIRIQFTSCTTATFSWDSTGENAAGFGSGSYPIQSLVPTAFTTACQAVPFDQVVGNDWMNGTWYGGAARSGEGLLITKAADGVVFVAWFTYRPAGL